MARKAHRLGASKGKSNTPMVIPNVGKEQAKASLQKSKATSDTSAEAVRSAQESLESSEKVRAHQPWRVMVYLRRLCARLFRFTLLLVATTTTNNNNNAAAAAAAATNSSAAKSNNAHVSSASALEEGGDMESSVTGEESRVNGQAVSGIEKKLKDFKVVAEVVEAQAIRAVEYSKDCSLLAVGTNGSGAQ